MRDNHCRLLEWVFSFIYVDLRKLGAGDTAKLLIELELVLKGSPPDEMTVGLFQRMNELRAVGLAPPPDEYEVDLETAKRIQSKVRDRVIGIMERLAKAREFEGKLLPEQDFQEIRTIAVFDKPLRSTGEIWGSVKHHLSEEGGETAVEFAKDALDEARIRIYTRARRHEDQVFHQFFLALDDMPFNAFRKCENCSHWFVNVSGRNKIFCSQKCAARKASRDSYDRKHPRPGKSSLSGKSQTKSKTAKQKRQGNQVRKGSTK